MAPFELRLSSASDTRYDVVVTEVDEDDVTAARVGTLVELEIETPGQAVGATVDLEAGDRIFVETIESIAGGFTLLDFAGVEIASWAPFLHSEVLSIAGGGAHTVRYEAIGTRVGTVALIVHRVPPDVRVEAAPGDTVESEIATPGQLASVPIGLEAGQTVEFDGRGSIPGLFTMTAPDTSEVANWRQFLASGPIEIASSGGYLVSFDALAEAAGVVTLVISEPG